jgi:hypothetical protein
VTTTLSPSTTLSSAELRRSVTLYEIKPGVKFSEATLKALLPDVETVLFFGKVYELDAQQLGQLLYIVLKSDLASALFAEGGAHSNDLQSYLVGYHDEYGTWHPGIIDPVTAGQISFDNVVPKGEILPHVWKSLEVEVAASIKAVAAKINDAVQLFPGKQGHMVFGHMMKLNAKRPTIGDFKASIKHKRQTQNLVILDVSGSMSASTVARITPDVVAMSYEANAHLAIVSNRCTYWQPGTYNVDDILAAAEYAGTHYETLQPLFDRDWGVVVTVADYDSSYGAKEALASCTGRIEQVLDISLVGQPTFLAECVGQLASEVKPLLTGNSYSVLRH